jgi:hypothetical protein
MNNLLAKLAKSSLGAAFSVVPPWAYILLLVIGSCLFGGWVNGMRVSQQYQTKVTELKTQYTARENALNLELAAQQQKVIVAVQKNQEQTAALDAKFYKEKQDANKTIDNLRAQLHAGTVRLRKPTTSGGGSTQQSATDEASSVGNGENSQQGTSPTGTEQGILEHTLNIAEMANTCISQRGYLQEKIKTDTEMETAKWGQ